MYSSTDNEARIADLQSGKMYQAWKQMREALLELKGRDLPELGVGGYGVKGGARPRDAPRPSDRGGASSGDRGPDRGPDRDHDRRRDEDRGRDRHDDRHDRDRRDRDNCAPQPATTSLPLHRASRHSRIAPLAPRAPSSPASDVLPCVRTAQTTAAGTTAATTTATPTGGTITGGTTTAGATTTTTADGSRRGDSYDRRDRY